MATPPAFSSEFWQRVTQVTADALERPADERDAWLAGQCASDEALRREVESLLAADARAGRFLQVSALASSGAADVVTSVARESLGLVAGRRIGPYQIIRELGHGGMGVVYLAARADLAFEKQVAVKVVRAGAAGDLVWQRFHAERRILATLDHPHIARLLDGGVTPDGLSYFVMEYVDGVSLDAYCEAARLVLQARLALFRQVCAAVRYAHNRLVIHRDIKPRNILVTAEGTPKLLDFGIAKLLDPEVQSGQTVTGRAFTLEYASPEQIRGEPMSVTSDVYALGVLLYRLIAGRRPCGATAVADTDLMRAICDEPPVRPALAAQTGTGFAVSAELEWIVLKALRKEPNRRYESVDRLTDDLDRLVNGRPVLAGPDSRRYRAGKFIRRHRFAVAAGVLLLTSLVAGMTTTLWQARRADEQRARAELRFQNARRLANAMVFELNDAIETGATSARALLLTRASEQLDALALDSPDDPVLAEELATAYHRLGDAQGRAGSANLGDSAAALTNHRKGLAIRQTLATRSLDDLEAKSRLVASLLNTASAENQSAPAIQHVETAIAIAQSLHDARAGDAGFQRLLAGAYYGLGARLLGISDTARALTSFETALPLYQAIYAANPGDAELRRSLALCHKRLGAIIAIREPAQALDHMRRAVALDEAGVAATPQAPQRQRDLSTSNIQLGYGLRRVGDSQGALAAYQRALALREELMRADPKDAQARRDVASVLWYIGDLNSAKGRHLDALTLFQRALLLTTDATMSVLTMSGFADALQNLGRLTESIAMRERTLERARALMVKDPKLPVLRRSLVRDLRMMGDTLVRFADQAADPAQRRARLTGACAAYDEGLNVSGGLGANGALDPADQSEVDAIRDGRGRCR